MKKSKSTGSLRRLRRSNRSRRSRKCKSGSSRGNRRYRQRSFNGGNLSQSPPPSYVGAIQGKLINIDGQKLFTNPAGGIA